MFRRFGVSKRWNLILDAIVFGFVVIGSVQMMLFVTYFDRALPLTVHFRVIKTLSVQAGEKFEYWNFFTRKQYCDTKVTRWFITSEGAKIDIAPLPSFMPTEALNTLQATLASIRTPRNMPPGISKSCFQSEWQCNFVQNWWPLKGPETCLTFIIDPKPVPPQTFTPVPGFPAHYVFLEGDSSVDGN